MKTWIKLYTEFHRDPDIGMLTWAQRGMIASLFSLAGEIDARDENGEETGALDTCTKTAWCLRCSEDDIRQIMAEWGEGRHLVERDGVLFIANYGARQRRKPSDSKEAVADRVRRSRAALHAPCNADVTPLYRPVSRSDSESDSELDTDTEGMALSAPAATPPPPPEPEPKPVLEKKTNIRSDPRSKTPAIQCVYAICDKRYPPKALFDTIIATLGDTPDGHRLRKCRQEWVERGYNGSSWKWLTEWYVTGIPPRNGAKNGGPPGYGRKQTGAIETDLAVWEADARAIAAGRE